MNTWQQMDVATAVQIDEPTLSLVARIRDEAQTIVEKRMYTEHDVHNTVYRYNVSRILVHAIFHCAQGRSGK